MTSQKKIRLLIVDDSALVQKMLTRALSEYSDIEVIACASDPYEARDKVVRLKPDVLTLDIEMPRMDGLTFLGKLMKHFPMPVVMVSSVAQKNSENALRALQLGAVDIVPKPGSSYTIPDVQDKLVGAIRAASHASVARLKAPRPVVAQRPKAAPLPTDGAPANRLVAIGSSTGGVRALEVVLGKLAPGCPPVVVVQHIPKDFVAGLADRLNGCTPLNVGVAEHNTVLRSGMVLLSPGDIHMTVARGAAGFVTRLEATPPVNHHRPSVDVLFHSLAKSAGGSVMGAILTGMGRDGAEGLAAMRKAGAHTVAEAQETCVVYGMPRAAMEHGAAVKQLRLEAIGDEVMAWARGTHHQASAGGSIHAAVGA